MTPQEVLALAVPPCDAGQGLTVRTYLLGLLAKVWDEQEGFSGKRPWGNSAWEFDLYLPLVRAGAVAGELDEDGYIVTYDRQAADALIAAAIRAL